MREMTVNLKVSRHPTPIKPPGILGTSPRHRPSSAAAHMWVLFVYHTLQTRGPLGVRGLTSCRSNTRLDRLGANQGFSISEHAQSHEVT